MTVQAAILRADELRPNTFSDDIKYLWLSELDGRIKTDVFDTHAGYENVEAPDYNLGNRTKELLAPEPYSDIYVYWLFMKMDLMNGEFDLFNNDAMLYNTAWLAFANFVNRTHDVKTRAKIKNA